MRYSPPPSGLHLRHPAHVCRPEGNAAGGSYVTVSLTRDEEKNVTNIHREIELIYALNQEEKDKLMAIANKCPVHKTLTNPILIETKIKE